MKRKINKRLLYALKIVQRSKVKLYEERLKDLEKLFNKTILKSRRCGYTSNNFWARSQDWALQFIYQKFIKKWKIK